MSGKPVSSKHFIFYFLFAVAHLAAILAGSGFEKVVMITKPLLLPALIIVFYRLTRKRENRRRKFVFAALIFSWLGDVTLMFQEKNPNYFLIGLVCFLLAHVAYIIAFNLVSSSQTSLLRKNPLLAALFIVYAAIVFYIIRNGLASMLIPVVVYMGIILIMSMSALNRFGKVSLRSFQLVFLGAICFMLSDSLLAVNKFSQPIPSASFLIMLTYILAQYLIVKGMIEEAKDEAGNSE